MRCTNKYMHRISDRLTQVQNSIQSLALSCDRKPDDVLLLAVSKTHPATAIEAAFHAGQRHFGENYLQEAVAKIAALAHLPLCWHFIGPLQSNKTGAVAAHFDWVHTVDRVKIAERLNQQRPSDLPPLNICIQVNIDREPSKSGCLPEAAAALCQQVMSLPGLNLRGLMSIPRPGNSADAFRRVAQLQQQIADATGLAPDTLSMGMSDDLPEAIAAGATIVRVGTAIFGPRPA